MRNEAGSVKDNMMMCDVRVRLANLVQAPRSSLVRRPSFMLV